MINKLVFFIFVFNLYGAIAQAQQLSKKYFLNLMKESYENDDDLGLRVAIKNLAKFDIEEKEWLQARKYIHRQPAVGHDLLFKWDEFGYKKNYSILLAGDNVNKLLQRADELMLAGSFEEAFKIYQKIAKYLKIEMRKSKADNFILYQSTVHSMARALYGAKRFNDALEVYSWLDQDYPRIRQVIFEKMWTAFKLGKIDYALGAIASQKSSYFSKFMEPESYLLLIYIFKQLCRQKDITEVKKEIEEFVSSIKKTDQNGYKSWAKTDMETFSLLRLSETQAKKEDSPTLAKMKIEEQNKIKDILKRAYTVDIRRIEQNLNKILAYSNIAIGSKSKFTTSQDVNDRKALLDKGYEFWPNTDTEDWVDEIGNHVYIGASLCK